MNTSEDLFRVVYFSRNALSAPPQEQIRQINDILSISQQHNQEAGVTGVMVFNNGVFGQVLEGPMEEVEEIFDRIQADERHHDVTILQAKSIEARSFAHWSMGYVGASEDQEALFAAIGDLTDFDAGRLNADEIFAKLADLAKQNEVSMRAA